VLKLRQILVDPDVLNGNPHIEDTGLTVFDVLLDLKHDGVDATLSVTDLTRDELAGTLRYCCERRCDVDHSHCGGCSLRLKQDGICNKQDFVDRFSLVRFAESPEVLKGAGQGTIIMPGTLDELDISWRGERGWELAEQLLSETTLGKP